MDKNKLKYLNILEKTIEKLEQYRQYLQECLNIANSGECHLHSKIQTVKDIRTDNYLDIPAIKIGLDYIENIGIKRINERVASLRKYVFERLENLKHENGQSLVQIFGPKNHQNLGGTIILAFYNKDGIRYEFEQIEEQANQFNISLRSGCFCNPGIDETNNCLTDNELATYYSSHQEGDYKDMIKFLGKMRGATRISVGIATNQNDINQLINFLETLLNQ